MDMIVVQVANVKDVPTWQLRVPEVHGSAEYQQAEAKESSYSDSRLVLQQSALMKKDTALK